MMKNIPENVKKIYFMGICGTGMGSLAGLLKDMGYDVCGSDENVYPPMSDQLAALNIPVYAPFSPENLEKAKPDLVIVGNVMMEKYPESQALLQSGIPFTSMPQAMKHFLLQDKEVIVISGTHGKTTTTSLMAHLLEGLGEDPGYFIGGVLQSGKKSFKVGKGKYFAIEGDEYDTAFFEKTPKFIHYNPKHVIMTSLEFDHADIYDNLQQIEDAFSSLSKLIPEDGSLHHCANFELLAEVVPFFHGFKRSYGTVGPADWLIEDYEADAEGSTFNITRGEAPTLAIKSPLTGRYNAQNVTACLSVLDNLGFDVQKAIEVLQTFPGIKRRQEIRYQDDDFVVIDDFAHHPTAVSKTIRAINEKFPDHQLVAIFEPRSNTSIRDIFQEEYSQSFDLADEVHLPPLQNTHKVQDGQVLDLESLAETLQDAGTEAYLHNDVDSIVETVTQESPKPVVALVMSNGSFDNIHNKLIEAWKSLNQK